MVLVLPSIDGLTSFEKDLCRQLARHGLAAIAIDFYREQDGNPADAYNSLTDSRAVTDLDEVHEFVISDDVDWAVADDVGILGIDVGGRFGLVAAATRPWVKSLAPRLHPADRGRRARLPSSGLLGKACRFRCWGCMEWKTSSSTTRRLMRRRDGTTTDNGSSMRKPATGSWTSPETATTRPQRTTRWPESSLSLAPLSPRRLKRISASSEHGLPRPSESRCGLRRCRPLTLRFRGHQLLGRVRLAPK